MADARAKQDHPPAAQPPTSEERRWTAYECLIHGLVPAESCAGAMICCVAIGEDETCGLEVEKPVEVVEASAYDSLARELRGLKVERQEVIDCINLYGDDTLHRALDSIGFLAHHPEEGT